MHLSMKSHHLLAGKDLALVCRDKDVLSSKPIFLSYAFYCCFCSLGIPALQLLGSFFWYFAFIAVAFIGSQGSSGQNRSLGTPRVDVICGRVECLSEVNCLYVTCWC